MSLRFPKMGVPRTIIHFRSGFSLIDHFGVAPFMETSICFPWNHGFRSRSSKPMHQWLKPGHIAQHAESTSIGDNSSFLAQKKGKARTSNSHYPWRPVLEGLPFDWMVADWKGVPKAKDPRKTTKSRGEVDMAFFLLKHDILVFFRVISTKSWHPRAKQTWQ